MFFYSTIFIYLSLTVIMFLLCWWAYKNNKWGPVIMAVAIYAIIFGCRYGVGKDFFAYEYMYNQKLYGLGGIIDYEFGFRFIVDSLAALKMHSSVFFGTIAFLQLILIFMSIKKDKYVYTYLVFTFMIGCVWLSFSNGIRQETAFCFFALALAYTDKKNWIKHYCLILLAISMHNSAYLLLVFFPLLLYKEEWFTNVQLQLCVLLAAYLIGESRIISNYLYLFDEILAMDIFSGGYDVYAGNEEKIFAEVSKGIGYYLILVTDFILVAYSNKFKRNMNSKALITMYNFYFIGTILKHAFIDSHLIQRVNYYFYGFQFIIAAYTLYYLHKSKSYKTFTCLILIYILTFVANMSKMEGHTALFRFFWEKDIII